MFLQASKSGNAALQALQKMMILNEKMHSLANALSIPIRFHTME
jgi:hypothetical protein